MGMRKCWVVEWHQEAVMELSVDVCVVVRVEEKEKPGLRGWLQKWWARRTAPQQEYLYGIKHDVLVYDKLGRTPESTKHLPVVNHDILLK